MNISRILATVILFLSLLTVGSFTERALTAKSESDEVRRLGSLTKASAALVDATVALSLERSVSQVSLAYPEPAPQAFRDLIAQQRALGEDAFVRAYDILSDEGLGEQTTALMRRLDDYRARYEALRAEVDGTIAKPATERDADRVHALPSELKHTISSMNATLKLLHPRDGVSTARAQALAVVQDRAWEAREYGGRARTYFAIAVLNGAPLSPGALTALSGDNAFAETAWDSLSNIVEASPLGGAIDAALKDARETYFETYVPQMERLLAASQEALSSGAPPDYGVSFQTFFTESNRALDALSTLANVAGAERVSYWSERERVVTRDFFLSMFVAGGVLVAGLGAVWLVQALVSSRLSAITRALGAAAKGAPAPEHRPKASDLAELRQLNEVLVAFQAKQSALDDAEDRRREAEAARKSMLADLQGALGATVQAAMAGDLRARVRTDFADPELQALAADVNALLADTEAGLGSASAALDALSRGDLGAAMLGDLRGAFAALSASFERSVNGLADAMREVETVATDVSGANAAITRGAGELAARAEAEAAALERTKRLLTEISDLVHRNIEAARLAKDLSARNETAAETGVDVMASAVEAMRRIEESAGKIGDIVGVIDSIAFQTNLLALNASVEAARAGEAGKGFAVVASEVRALAQRSAEAARDIRSLIEDSGARVAQGVSLVEKTGENLGGMRELAAAASSRVDEINEICGEQRVGLEGVEGAMGALDRLARESVDQAADSGEAASALDAGAQKLNEAISAFNVPRRAVSARAA